MTTDITFMTGNQNKADYLAKLLGQDIAHFKLDLTEIQSTNMHDIVEHKVRQAYDVMHKPVLVEDVYLTFTALGDLPGPFIKFFLENSAGERPDGLENLCRMLDGFTDRSAIGGCTFGYYDGQRLQFFDGLIRGTIAEHPAGERGFGWDKIFCPEGYDGRTRAQLTEIEYDELYQVIRPFAALRAFFDTAK